MIRPALTIEQTITLLRHRYPDALICTQCGVLLAALPASYAKADLTEAERLAFVCAECRWEAAEATRLAGISRQNLAAARAAKQAQRGTMQVDQREPASSPNISATSHTLFRRGRAAQPGRPLVSRSEQRRKARERDRAYRLRQRAPAEAA